MQFELKGGKLRPEAQTALSPPGLNPDILPAMPANVNAVAFCDNFGTFVFSILHAHTH